ncbi:GAF domain-containing protein [Halobaculum sp. WSA2]|uniref:histidine kinase n=1 Tax=Halobaculum saliterrae TaxID=2073113 RepID=A0A6B0T2E9_9EURY|nr:GAF domain-containing protein [Halobaculum saliterrae]MXR40709.1 GAF domain-containing protein [Halobaculum saliterrae]
MSTAEGIHVLHVDDDPDFAELVAEMLEREGKCISVETATSAAEGLDRLAATEFDCVVSDYQMPGQNGIEFLETVREDRSDLPFILYTGKGSEEVASDAISAGATDYLQKGDGIDQYRLLANRIQNAVEQYRAHHRAAEFERIRTLASDINQALVRADTRSALEDRVCEVVSDSDPYLFAWIGEVDAETDRIEPRAWAGLEEGYLDAITVTVDETATGVGPGGTAVRTHRVAVSQNVHEDAVVTPWRDAALERGFQAIAAVPLVFKGTLFGVLCIYSECPYAFDADEQELLAELGDDIAHAIHTLALRDELREEREMIDQAINSLDDIFYHLDPDGTLRRWNDRFTEVTGYTDAELDQMQATDFFAERDRPTVETALDEALATGESIVEAELLTAEGVSIPYEFTGSRFTSTDGDVLGIIGIGRDISDRKAREQKLTALHTVANELTASESAEAAYEHTIRASAEILNLDVSVVNIENGGELVPVAVPDEVPEDRVTTMSVDEGITGKTYRTGESFLIGDLTTWEDARPQGPFNSVISIPIENHGVFQAVAEAPNAFDETDFELTKLLINHTASVLDRLTHEQQLEQQTERLREFANVVSHDLRNPLNVAQGRVELARENCSSENLADAANAIDRSLTLIDDLLTLAREGEEVSDVETVDLADLCSRTWHNVETAAATIEVNTTLSIRADPNRVQQLLENLFRNAVEHGGEDVTVTVGSLDDRPGFFVADDGPGIAPDNRDEVFEAGYSRIDDGTGFGLNIVRKIAQAHGWDTTVGHSNSGGARFEIGGVDIESQ